MGVRDGFEWFELGSNWVLVLGLVLVWIGLNGQNGENGLFSRFDRHFSRFGSSLSNKNRNFAASKQQINIYKQFKTLRIWKKKRKQLSKSSSSKRLTVAKVQQYTHVTMAMCPQRVYLDKKNIDLNDYNYGRRKEKN